jgi:hypothetical protein
VGSALSNAIPKISIQTSTGKDRMGSWCYSVQPYSRRYRAESDVSRHRHLVNICRNYGYAIALLIKPDSGAVGVGNHVLALALLGPLLIAALIIAAFLFFLKWFIGKATGNDGDADAPTWIGTTDVPGAVRPSA